MDHSRSSSAVVCIVISSTLWIQSIFVFGNIFFWRTFPPLSTSQQYSPAKWKTIKKIDISIIDWRRHTHCRLECAHSILCFPAIWRSYSRSRRQHKRHHLSSSRDMPLMFTIDSGRNAFTFAHHRKKKNHLFVVASAPSRTLCLFLFFTFQTPPLDNAPVFLSVQAKFNDTVSVLVWCARAALRHFTFDRKIWNQWNAIHKSQTKLINLFHFFFSLSRWVWDESIDWFSFFSLFLDKRW